ncbi:hypothetical protein [Nostoc sp. PA-18-2419]|uniref:hypothetical protein n=1 Tax=Nostoc sp. PA-18-2419 TaxID=2575443 RepID=UPI00110843E9|nr:hypothetical protein [Nostoc sp. PA-18-2419]
MSSIQADIRIPPHLHQKLAIYANQAEAFKSKVIINTLVRYQECTEAKLHPHSNFPITVIDRHKQPLSLAGNEPNYFYFYATS